MDRIPSIGRIVHAFGPEIPGGLTPPPEAAIIVGLHEHSSIVDLVVFQSNGIFHQHRVQFSHEPKPLSWTWPPMV